MKLLRQAGWISAEHGVGAVVQLALSAWLIAELGLHGFGTWTLLQAAAYLCGTLSLGLGSAVVRHVSAARTAEERAAWLRAALVLFGIALLVIAASAVVLVRLLGCDPIASCAWGGWLPTDAAATILRTGPALAAFVACEQFDALLVSALRAEQRYRAVAWVEIGSRLLWLGGLGAVATATADPAALMYAAPLLVLPKIALHVHLLARGGVRLLSRTRIERAKLAALLRYARWQWLRAAGVQLFGVVDRLVVAAVLGQAALGVYAVCVQLADPIYKVVVLATQPLFPWAARQAEPGGAMHRWRWPLFGLQGAIVVVGLLWIPLAQLALPLWLGADADDHAAVQAWAVIGYLLLALHAVPNYLQMGVGQVRGLAVASVAGGVASLALMAWAGSSGLLTVMQARCVYGLVLFATWPTVWRLLRPAAARGVHPSA